MNTQPRTQAMPLSPGTALQNGHYVIDALLETASTGTLYWGTHVVTGTRVYIQVYDLVVGLPPAKLSGLISRLEGLSFAPESLLPNPLRIFHEEGRLLCFVLGGSAGLPWAQRCHHHSPLPPLQAIQAIRRIAAGLTWLAAKNFGVTHLSPAQIWFASDRDHITLTGLPQGYLKEASSPASLTVVQSLAYLLWSFLTGKQPSHKTPPATLRDNLQQQLPQIHPALLQALHRGMNSQGGTDTSLDLTQWLTLLPDAPLTTAIPSMPTSEHSAQPSTSQPLKHFSGVYSTLGITALIAAIAGIALGGAWRFNAASLPGNIQFEPNQAFPPQTGWQGDTPEEASVAQPIEPAYPLFHEDAPTATDWAEPIPSSAAQEADWADPNADVWPLEERASTPLQEETQATDVEQASDTNLIPDDPIAEPELAPSSDPLTAEPTEDPIGEPPLPVSNENPEIFLNKPTPPVADEDVLSNAADPDTSISPAIPNAEVEPSTASDS